MLRTPASPVLGGPPAKDWKAVEGRENRRGILKQLSFGAAISLIARAVEPLAAQPPAAGKANRPRFRTSITAYSFRQDLEKKTMQYEDLVRLATELGVDGLDLTTYWFPSTSDDFLLPLRRLAYHLAVDLYSIGIHSTLCRSTTELQEAEVTSLRSWLDVAEKLGAGHVRLLAGRIPPGTSDDQAVQWTVETLKRCAEAAGQRGIMLGVEDDGAFTTDAERLVRIVKQVDSPWLGINLDVGNFPTDAYRRIEICAPYAVNVHLKDTVRENGKSEPADWERLLKILAPVYRGYLSLEYEGRDDPHTAVPQLIAKLRNLLVSYAARA